jgi:hypothetical protein
MTPVERCLPAAAGRGRGEHGKNGSPTDLGQRSMANVFRHTISLPVDAPSTWSGLAHHGLVPRPREGNAPDVASKTNLLAADIVL